MTTKSLLKAFVTAADDGLSGVTVIRRRGREALPVACCQVFQILFHTHIWLLGRYIENSTTSHGKSLRSLLPVCCRAVARPVVNQLLKSLQTLLRIFIGTNPERSRWKRQSVGNTSTRFFHRSLPTEPLQVVRNLPGKKPVLPSCGVHVPCHLWDLQLGWFEPVQIISNGISNRVNGRECFGVSTDRLVLLAAVPPLEPVEVSLTHALPKSIAVLLDPGEVDFSDADARESSVPRRVAEEVISVGGPDDDRGPRELCVTPLPDEPHIVVRGADEPLELF